jgi:uncharacterized protein
MLYAIWFEDDTTRAEARTQHMPGHLAFLERNAHLIRAAGPLIDVASCGAAGGLWLVEADKLEEVRALYESDPFWPTGLRKSVQVLEWRQVFAAGKRLI